MNGEEDAEMKERLDAAGVPDGRFRRFCLEGPDALKMTVDDVYSAMAAQGLRPLTPSAKALFSAQSAVASEEEQRLGEIADQAEALR